VDTVLDQVHATAGEAEAAGRLPARLIDVLADGGYLRMAVPAEFGGAPCSLPELLRRLTALAEADPSTAWVVMVWTQAQIVAARLGEHWFARLFADGPDVILAASAAGGGTATPVDGAFEVSGEWPFASGSSHASGVLVHCDLVSANPVRQIGVLLDRASLTADDSWRVLGLRATASNGVRADRVLVPVSHVYELDAPPCAAATLHSHLPFRPSFALHMGAIAVGNASAALRCSGRLPGGTDAPPAGGADDRGLGASCLAVEAQWLALDTCARQVWERVAGGEKIDEGIGRWMSAVGAHAVHTALNSTLAQYRSAGSAVIFDRHPLQRRLRDALTMSQHANVSQRNVANYVSTVSRGGCQEVGS
jgi:alkylation response protein AidB-like acyl-CoA dehydrogenase